MRCSSVSGASTRRRRHARAVEELRAAGLDNFNLDLMYALPGQDLGGALADVRTAIELAPGAHLALPAHDGAGHGVRRPAARGTPR